MVQLLFIGLSLWMSIIGCDEKGSTSIVSKNRVGENEVKKVLATMQDSVKKEDLEIATLGGGCFWCIEAVFDELKGVHKSISGYSGGKVDNPSYREVCYGNTGHAEVVDVYFDPKIVSYDDILRVFFHTHNPTTLNRQGNDIGTQYRSVIYFHNVAQEQTAKNIIQEIEKSGLWDDKIVTEVSNFTRFYAAEDVHQEYFKLNGHAPYCQYVINPKMTKFRKEFKDKLKSN